MNATREPMHLSVHGWSMHSGANLLDREATTIALPAVLRRTFDLSGLSKPLGLSTDRMLDPLSGPDSGCRAGGGGGLNLLGAAQEPAHLSVLSRPVQRPIFERTYLQRLRRSFSAAASLLFSRLGQRIALTI